MTLSEVKEIILKYPGISVYYCAVFLFHALENLCMPIYSNR